MDGLFNTSVPKLSADLYQFAQDIVVYGRQRNLSLMGCMPELSLRLHGYLRLLDHFGASLAHPLTLTPAANSSTLFSNLVTMHGWVARDLLELCRRQALPAGSRAHACWAEEFSHACGALYALSALPGAVKLPGATVTSGRVATAFLRCDALQCCARLLAHCPRDATPAAHVLAASLLLCQVIGAAVCHGERPDAGTTASGPSAGAADSPGPGCNPELNAEWVRALTSSALLEHAASTLLRLQEHEAGARAGTDAAAAVFAAAAAKRGGRGAKALLSEARNSLLLLTEHLGVPFLPMKPPHALCPRPLVVLSQQPHPVLSGALPEVRALLSGPCLQFWLGRELTLARLRLTGGRGPSHGLPGAELEPVPAAPVTRASAPRAPSRAQLEHDPLRQLLLLLQIACRAWRLTVSGPLPARLAQPPQGWLPPPAACDAAGLAPTPAPLHAAMPYKAVHVYDMAYEALLASCMTWDRPGGDAAVEPFCDLGLCGQEVVRLALELAPGAAARRLPGLWRALTPLLRSAGEGAGGVGVAGQLPFSASSKLEFVHYCGLLLRLEPGPGPAAPSREQPGTAAQQGAAAAAPDAASPSAAGDAVVAVDAVLAAAEATVAAADADAAPKQDAAVEAAAVPTAAAAVAVGAMVDAMTAAGSGAAGGLARGAEEAPSGVLTPAPGGQRPPAAPAAAAAAGAGCDAAPAAPSACSLSPPPHHPPAPSASRRTIRLLPQPPAAPSACSLSRPPHHPPAPSAPRRTTRLLPQPPLRGGRGAAAGGGAAAAAPDGRTRRVRDASAPTRRERDPALQRRVAGGAGPWVAPAGRGADRHAAQGGGRHGGPEAARRQRGGGDGTAVAHAPVEAATVWTVSYLAALLEQAASALLPLSSPSQPPMTAASALSGGGGGDGGGGASAGGPAGPGCGCGRGLASAPASSGPAGNGAAAPQLQEGTPTLPPLRAADPLELNNQLEAPLGTEMDPGWLARVGGQPTPAAARQQAALAVLALSEWMPVCTRILPGGLSWSEAYIRALARCGLAAALQCLRLQLLGPRVAAAADDDDDGACASAGPFIAERLECWRQLLLGDWHLLGWVGSVLFALTAEHGGFSAQTRQAVLPALLDLLEALALVGPAGAVLRVALCVEPAGAELPPPSPPSAAAAAVEEEQEPVQGLLQVIDGGVAELAACARAHRREALLRPTWRAPARRTCAPARHAPAAARSATAAARASWRTGRRATRRTARAARGRGRAPHAAALLLAGRALGSGACRGPALPSSGVA